MSPDTEEARIYNLVEDHINNERMGRTPPPMDLHSYYKSFKDRLFGSSIPDLSDQFVCVFQQLPFDAAGITLLSEDAVKHKVKPGIRINEKLMVFPSEAKVALLHEMIHAKDLLGHGEDFKVEINRLWRERAYLDPELIL